MKFVTICILSAVFCAKGEKKTTYVDYMADGVACKGFMTYDASKCTSAKKCPAVMIVQDWTGMNGYEMNRACMLADMGYVAFAADIYGVAMPKKTQADWVKASNAHGGNATKYMNKINGAFTKMLGYDFVDSTKLAALGYCFGGTGMVNLAMVGHKGFPGVTFPPGLLGVVSYHGGLSGGYAAPKNGTRPKLLLNSGGKDDKNEHISKLTNELESVSAVYQISRFGPNVGHSFTDWDAKMPGFSYDALSDSRSWQATGHFLKELFVSGVSPVAKPDMTKMPAGLKAMDVEYIADGVKCKGYMTYDSSKCSTASKCPAVMVVQDWNGMNDYEKQRSRLLAEKGYVAFAADIYGIDTPKTTMQDWVKASSAHGSNATKYMNKIHGAFTQMLTYGFVDSTKLAALGYCFGGTGMVNLAMVGHKGFPGVTFPQGLLGVVSYHGGLSSGYAAPKNGTRPKLLLNSGGKDDKNEHISKLTNDLESVGAVYQISRYGLNVGHSFTHWGSNSPGNAYDARADFRSWADTLDFLKEIFSTSAVGTTKPSAAQCKVPQETSANTTAPDGKVSGSVAVQLSLGLFALAAAQVCP